jgi:iron-sulfur cluster insertion protein
MVLSLVRITVFDKRKIWRQKMVEITDCAKTKILDMLKEENDPALKLRTFVQGGGCSGLSYGFTFDNEQNEDDFEFPLNDDFKVVVDSMSMQYLQGAVIDYRDDLSGSSFSIRNPNATTTCGCGSSFSV